MKANEATLRLMQLKKDLEYARDALENAYHPAVKLKLFNTAKEVLLMRADLYKSIMTLEKQLAANNRARETSKEGE